MHTGDVAHMDEGGSITIVDRIKDVIKSGGEWISSLQLENICSASAVVAEAAAFGVPDSTWGERPMVVVVLAPGGNAEEGETAVRGVVENSIKEGNISKWAKPDRILVVESIPKTIVGKIDKKLLRERYRDS